MDPVSGLPDGPGKLTRQTDLTVFPSLAVSGNNKTIPYNYASALCVYPLEFTPIKLLLFLALADLSIPPGAESQVETKTQRAPSGMPVTSFMPPMHVRV